MILPSFLNMYVGYFGSFYCAGCSRVMFFLAFHGGGGIEVAQFVTLEKAGSCFPRGQGDAERVGV